LDSIHLPNYLNLFLKIYYDTCNLTLPQADSKPTSTTNKDKPSNG